MWKSIKVREEIYNKLLEIDSRPGKALERLVYPERFDGTAKNQIEKDIQSLKKRIEKIEDFIFDKSGGMF